MSIGICDITPFSLQDYPNHTSCILWFGGCNFRCSYCHNPELIKGKKKKLALADIYSFLLSRKGLLDGVVLSGGECTLSNNLEDFIKEIKLLNFKVKIDTNGSNPELLRRLLKKKLIDYVALDYKAPAEKFSKVTGWQDFQSFHKSLKILCDSGIPMEVRTTIHSAILGKEDIVKIIDDLEECSFKGGYYLQNFRDSETLDFLPEHKLSFDPNSLEIPKSFKFSSRNF